MANEYRFVLQVDWIETTFQRSAASGTDEDVITLYVTTTHDNDSKASVGPVPIGKFISGSRGDLKPPIKTPELLVDSNTVVYLFCTINNAASQGVEKAVAQGLQVASDVVLGLAAGEFLVSRIVKGALAGFLAADADIGAWISGALNLASKSIEPVLEALGITDPDCDGPVFKPNDAMSLNTVGSIAKLWSDGNLHRLPIGIAAPVGVWTDTSQTSQKGCGHPPETTIRVSGIFTWRRYPIIVPGLKVAAVSTHKGATSLFALTDDGQVWSKFFDPDHLGPPERGGWSDWFPLGPKTFHGIFPDHPQVVAISTVPGGVQLFIQADDDMVWSKFLDPDHLGPSQLGGWSDWFALGQKTFPKGSPITAVSSKRRGVQVFVHGSDGQVWSKSFDPDHLGSSLSGGWSEWFPLGPKKFLRQQIRAVSGAPGAVQIFAVGDDGQIWSNFFDPQHPGPPQTGGWSDWFPLGPKTFKFGAFSVISSVPGGTQIYALGDDFQIWSKLFDPDHLGPPERGGWSDWFPLSPKTFLLSGTTIVAVSSVQRRVQLFVEGDDSQIWSKVFDPVKPGRPEFGGWSDWFPFGPNTFPNNTLPQSSGISVLSGKPGGTQLFCLGEDDQVWSQSFDPDHLGPPERGGWSGWFSLGP